MENSLDRRFKDISAVIPTLNSIDSIELCLKSLKDAGVGEIIVVDGGSSDGTAEIALRYADYVMNDEGTGLGNARNIGIRSATGRYILNSGADNAYDKNGLSQMLNILETTSFMAVSLKTVIKSTEYLARTLNIYFKARNFSGERETLGTPMMCAANTIKAHPFNETLTWSDDAELCTRWKATLGARFYMTDAEVEEVGDVNFKEIRARWRVYGISDSEVYTLQSPDWKKSRKIQSLLYPLRNEVILPLLSKRLSAIEKTRVSWFLLYIVAIRYVNWLKTAIKAL